MSCSILSPADWKAAQSALPASPASGRGAGDGGATIQGLVRTHILCASATKGETD